MKSISFDRAADIYDETRGFPPGIGDLVADSAMRALTPGASVAEVGIGTGRIAKPLISRGARITGIDLSRRMMRRLLDTLPPEQARPNLVEADASQLPLAAGAFDAVVSVHVFHLIANWRRALEEVRRVLKPGGVFLTGHDWRPDDSPGERLFRQWREIVKHDGPRGARLAAHDFGDVRDALIELGASVDEWSVGEWTTRRTVARQLETIEHRTWSSTWDVPEAFFAQRLAQLREWTVGEFGSLEREFTVPHRFVWQRFRWE